MDPPPSKSWSIHTRREITEKYEILERVGSGTYSDVYRARRRSDSLVVALKEVHDYQSAFREIEALQILQSSPNVVVLHEYFWREDEDAVLVLEFLPTDLASLIRVAKREWEGGILVGEIKRWILQILCGVDACHRNSIMHRDLKPSNLLISADGALKLADFGQARTFLEPGLVAIPQQLDELNTPNGMNALQPGGAIPETENASQEACENQEQVEGLNAKNSFDETNKDVNINDGDASCLATCTAGDREDDLLNGSYSYKVEDGGNDQSGPLTSCVGTRWYRAPELLYGSTNYGPEIDLWSLGCIFVELYSLEPLFPGNSDIDQIYRIFNILGNLTEEVWPACSQLPDYKIISFGRVENPTGLEACLPNQSPDEINLVKKLLCFNPASRATAMELLREKYLTEEPLPLPLSELRVPPALGAQDEGSGEWCDYQYMDSSSGSDFDDFGPVNIRTTDNGFSIQFP